MTAAARIESELERRYQIRLVDADLVQHLVILDSHAVIPECREGLPLFSTHERDAAEAIMPAIGQRSVDGDGWVLAWPWGATSHDHLRARLGDAYAAELARRGATW